MIGILISVDQELETIPKIEFKFKGTEGGPSGGFMMSLAIYDTLTGSKLSQNRKIIGTGSIDQYGNVGEIGGVKYKIKVLLRLMQIYSLFLLVKIMKMLWKLN